MTGRTVCLRMFAVLLFVTSISACRNESAKQAVGLPIASSDATFNVAILGDATRNDLLTKIGAAHDVTVKIIGPRKVVDTGSIRFLTCEQDSIATQCSLAWDADLIMIAVDATQGPLPVHREHVLISRQLGAPIVVIAFTKSREVDDPDLLELEELEMRELLNTYTLPGDTATCVFDHEAAKAPAGSKASKGPLEIVTSLGAIAKRRNPTVAAHEEKRFKASIYALGPQEAYRRDVAVALKTGPTTVLVGNDSVAAELTAPREIAPGENGEIEIVFEKAIRVGNGQRFLLLNKQHVSATGFFLEKSVSSR